MSATEIIDKAATASTVSLPGYSGAYNRGPYTGTFSPPVTCRQSATMYTADDGAGAAAGTIYFGHWWSGDMDCYPTGSIPQTSYTHYQFWYSYYYSPGYYCPSSWHTAATLADGWAGETLTGSRNGVLCCPSGLTLYNNWTHACATSVSSGDVITLVTNHVAMETTISSSSLLYQDGIPLIRDRIITETDASSTITPGATLATATAEATSATSSAESTTSSSGGLTTGAKAGIGVGVGAGVPLLVAMAYIFVWRKRKSAGSTTSVEREVVQGEVYKQQQQPDFAELQGESRRVAELEAQQRPSELAS
ncbi:hypothetical protein ASPBRDRAFT_191322 [Aspergillus brasiliensis CBS 101740]|uniref:Uncharacterized protein n=1 Tax=Aspergillus brasiliensis (strain CBS 101740 / IMI 381727 / IBT 21946) TaxID=767769 RepID=A0A1L9V291_ASPBC|nr:hypothetical protein ASPBRDRAFT_191322 [Aspergillus brasiliensis CBS 101740]